MDRNLPGDRGRTWAPPFDAAIEFAASPAARGIPQSSRAAKLTASRSTSLKKYGIAASDQTTNVLYRALCIGSAAGTFQTGRR